MNWLKIKQLYPNKFLLLGNLVEKPISANKFKILEAEVLMVSDNAKEIQKAYQDYNHQGKDVLYSLPNTPEEFIVENEVFKGIIR